MPVVFNDRCSEVPQVQRVDKVVHVPVVQVLVAPQVVDVLAVAVHRQGVDVPVILQGLEIPWYSFGWSSTCPLVCKRQVYGSDSAKLLKQGSQCKLYHRFMAQTVQKNCGSAVDKVVDVSAVAVHRRGVDVPAIMQRRRT